MVKTSKDGENYDFATIEIIRLLRVNYFEKIWLPLKHVLQFPNVPSKPIRFLNNY